MATKPPALRAVPGRAQPRGRQLQREVSAIIRRHLEGACARALAEVAERFNTRPLFSKDDPATTSALQATRALVASLTQGLSRLAVAALMLPFRGSPSRHRRWTVSKAKLAAVPGGRNGHAADDWRPGDPSSSR
jgi:hypothetical protein